MRVPCAADEYGFTTTSSAMIKYDKLDLNWAYTLDLITLMLHNQAQYAASFSTRQSQ